MNRGPKFLAGLGVALVCGWLATDSLQWTDQLTIISGTLPEGGLAPGRLAVTLALWALSSIVAPVLLAASLLWAFWDWAIPLRVDTTAA